VSNAPLPVHSGGSVPFLEYFFPDPELTKPTLPVHSGEDTRFEGSKADWICDGCGAIRDPSSGRVFSRQTYATARSFFSAIPKRSSVPTLDVITLQSNQSMIRFCSDRSSHTNQAKQVLLGARGPCHP